MWKKFAILGTRDRLRMLDDSLTAEMVGFLLEGIQDGAQSKINALYTKYDNSFDAQRIADLDLVLSRLAIDFCPYLTETPVLNPPHLLMLFSALAHVLIGIPESDPLQHTLPPRVPLANIDQVRDNVLKLGSIIAGSDEPPAPYTDFWKASKSSTTRVGSRRKRFEWFYKAITGNIP